MVTLKLGYCLWLRGHQHIQKADYTPLHLYYYYYWNSPNSDVIYLLYRNLELQKTLTFHVESIKMKRQIFSTQVDCAT